MHTIALQGNVFHMLFLLTVLWEDILLQKQSKDSNVQVTIFI